MKQVSDEEMDHLIDEGEDLSDYMDLENATHFYPQADDPKTVNLTLPTWLVSYLDSEAKRRGIARKALINCVLVDWADTTYRNTHSLSASQGPSPRQA